MKCQRARIIRVEDTNDAWAVGAELWVEQGPGIIPHVQGKNWEGATSAVSAIKRGVLTPYANRDGICAVVNCELIERLARGPEDFMELREALDFEQWLADARAAHGRGHAVPQE